MGQRIIDPAVTLTTGIRLDPSGLGPEIDCPSHADGAGAFAAMFGLPDIVLRDGNGDWSLLRVGHKTGADTICCHMEMPGNLHPLPVTGFRVVALPVQVERGSAGWCRPVAQTGDCLQGGEP